MEWVISGLIAISGIFLIVCFVEANANDDICFKDLSVFGKIARIVTYSLIIGFVCGGILFLLTAAVKALIFG